MNKFNHGGERLAHQKLQNIAGLRDGVKTAVLPEAIYRFTAIPVKTPNFK